MRLKVSVTLDSLSVGVSGTRSEEPLVSIERMFLLVVLITIVVGSGETVGIKAITI